MAYLQEGIHSRSRRKNY